MLTDSTKKDTGITTKYTADLGVTGLASAIAATAKTMINSAKVTNKGTEVKDNGNGSIDTYEVDLPGTALPVSTSTDIIIEAIAYAVVYHIYKDIKANLELKAGDFVLSAGTIVGSLTGAGGGVVGPVTVTGGSVTSEKGTVDIKPGTFK